MSCALVIGIDGGVTELEVPATSHDRLQALYAAIGCHTVDVVRLTTRLDMWVDDEGMFTQPVNLAATVLARHYGRTAQFYHGPAVIAGLDSQGTTIALTDDQIHGVLTRLHDVSKSI